MRVLLALLLALPATCLAQAFQPDANYNGVIDANDLLSFLPLFGGDFTPSTAGANGILFINVDDFLVNPSDHPGLSVELDSYYSFIVYIEDGWQGPDNMNVSLSYSNTWINGLQIVAVQLNIYLPYASPEAFDIIHVVGDYQTGADSLLSIYCQIDPDQTPEPYSELRIINESPVDLDWNFPVADHTGLIVELNKWSKIIYNPIPFEDDVLGPINWRQTPGW